MNRCPQHPLAAPQAGKPRAGGRDASWRSAGLSALTLILAALSSLALLLLSACASPGAAPPPHAYLQPHDAGADAAATQWPAARWWQAWGDSGLDRLVDRALADQPSLQTTQVRLRQAQAALDAAGGLRAPQVNASADFTDQRFTANGLYPPPLAGSVQWSNNAQIGASWELDLFGRQRAAIESAIGQLHAAAADAQAAQVLLASNTAAAWFNLGRLVEARAVAAASLEQRQQVLDLVRQRVGAGLDTTVDLRQAEGLVAQSRVEIESLAESAQRARHALAELTGQGPQALDGVEPTLAAVRSAPLPEGLPADLLGRRADLVAQRWRVEAALRDVDVARAQFYPDINLMAFVGLSSIGLDKFVQSGSATYGAGPALHLPIFDGGRLRANLGSRRAEVDAAVDAYNSALLRALREVADEVASLRSLEMQQRGQADATQAADAAFDLALQRYRAGLGNFLTVLTAQTNVLAQRRNDTELKARHLAAEVALARALGGGYAAGAEALPTLRADAASNKKTP
jgi:NodT family efflux transporter outer membrane factor (OMF) lipoprotein